MPDLDATSKLDCTSPSPDAPEQSASSQSALQPCNAASKLDCTSTPIEPASLPEQAVPAAAPVPEPAAASQHGQHRASPRLSAELPQPQQGKQNKQLQAEQELLLHPLPDVLPQKKRTQPSRGSSVISSALARCSEGGMWGRFLV